MRVDRIGERSDLDREARGDKRFDASPVGSDLNSSHQFSPAPIDPASVEAIQSTIEKIFRSDVYSDAMQLICRSAPHRTMPVGLVDAMVRSAISLSQLKLYRRQGQPVAIAIWAYLNEDVERRVLDGGTGVTPSELNVGDHLWTIAIISPELDLEIVRNDLLANVFGELPYRELSLRRIPESNTAPIGQSPASPRLSYRSAQREDIAALAPRLRRQDKMELLAATGRDATTALMDSFKNAKRCWSCLLDGQVIAMFGVGHIRNQPKNGRVWMLGSDDVFRQRRALLHDGPLWIREMMKGHTAIGNFVDARNETYIRWLKRLGFRFVKLYDHYGLEKKPFWEFSITPAEVAGTKE